MHTSPSSPPPSRSLLTPSSEEPHTTTETPPLTPPLPAYPPPLSPPPTSHSLLPPPYNDPKTPMETPPSTPPLPSSPPPLSPPVNVPRMSVTISPATTFLQSSFQKIHSSSTNPRTPSKAYQDLLFKRVEGPPGFQTPKLGTDVGHPPQELAHPGFQTPSKAYQDMFFNTDASFRCHRPEESDQDISHCKINPYADQLPQELEGPPGFQTPKLGTDVGHPPQELARPGFQTPSKAYRDVFFNTDASFRCHPPEESDQDITHAKINRYADHLPQELEGPPGFQTPKLGTDVGHPPQELASPGFQTPRSGTDALAEGDHSPEIQKNPWINIDNPFIIPSLTTLHTRKCFHVEGLLQCSNPACRKDQTCKFWIVGRVKKIEEYVATHRDILNGAIPTEWFEPNKPDCKHCGQAHSMAPITTGEVDWLFYFCAGLLGTLPNQKLKSFLSLNKVSNKQGNKPELLYKVVLVILRCLNK